MWKKTWRKPGYVFSVEVWGIKNSEPHLLSLSPAVPSCPKLRLSPGLLQCLPGGLSASVLPAFKKAALAILVKMLEKWFLGWRPWDHRQFQQFTGTQESMYCHTQGYELSQRRIQTQFTKGEGMCGGVQGKPGTSFHNGVAADTFNPASGRLWPHV